MAIEEGTIDPLHENRLIREDQERSPNKTVGFAQSLNLTLAKAKNLIQQCNQQLKTPNNIGLDCQLSKPQLKHNWQTICEQCHIGIAFISPSGQFLYVNQYLCNLLQYSASVICSSNFQDITHAEDLEVAWKYLDQILSGSQSHKSIEQRYLRQDGQWQWVNISLSVVHNSQNVPLYLIATIHDIQQSKQAEAKLKYQLTVDAAIVQISRKLTERAEVNYEEILGIIGNATQCDRVYLTRFVPDAQSHIYYWSKYTGNSQLQSRQILAMHQFSWWQTKLDSDRSIIIENVAQLPDIAQREKNLLQSLNICSVLAIPLYNSSAQLWGTLSLCNQDKSDRNWSREDAQKLRILGGIIQSNHQYREEQQALERQISYRHLLKSITFKISQSLNIQEILQATVTELQKTFNADRVLLLQFMADGTGKVIQSSVQPEFPAMVQKNIIDEYCRDILLRQYADGDICVYEDVDNENLSSCHRDFLQRYQIKANLVLPISRYLPVKHYTFSTQQSTQISNHLWGLLCVQQCSQSYQWTQDEIELLQHLVLQLTIALSQAELLESEINQRKELARSNTELEQFAYIASHDLQAPLQTISNYARLLQSRYQGQLDAKGEKFLNYITEGVYRMHTQIKDLLEYSRVGRQKSTFRTTDCNLVVKQAIANLRSEIEKQQASVTYCHNLPTLIANSSQLVVLFQNLISNAIKYHTKAKPIIKISACRQGDNWQFFVRDNGIGIETKYQQRIFQIFQRLHTQEEYPGTGIGLAICQKIVELHGGKIEVDSQLNRGSTFYFTLPS